MSITKHTNSGNFFLMEKHQKLGKTCGKFLQMELLNLEEEQFDLKLSGRSNGSHVKLHGNASGEAISTTKSYFPEICRNRRTETCMQFPL